MLKCYKYSSRLDCILKYDTYSQIKLEYNDTYIKTDDNKIISIIIKLYDKITNKPYDKEYIIDTNDYELILNNSSYTIQELIDAMLIYDHSYKLKPRYCKVIKCNYNPHQNIYECQNDDILKIEGFTVEKITMYIRNDVEYLVNLDILDMYFKHSNVYKNVTEQYTRDNKLKYLLINFVD